MVAMARRAANLAILAAAMVAAGMVVAGLAVAAMAEVSCPSRLAYPHGYLYRRSRYPGVRLIRGFRHRRRHRRLPAAVWAVVDGATPGTRVRGLREGGMVVVQAGELA